MILVTAKMMRCSNALISWLLMKVRSFVACNQAYLRKSSHRINVVTHLWQVLLQEYAESVYIQKTQS